MTFVCRHTCNISSSSCRHQHLQRRQRVVCVCVRLQRAELQVCEEKMRQLQQNSGPVDRVQTHETVTLHQIWISKQFPQRNIDVIRRPVRCQTNATHWRKLVCVCLINFRMKTLLPANTWTLSATLVVICLSWTLVMRPRGNTTTMSTSPSPETLLMAELPVSPDVPVRRQRSSSFLSFHPSADYTVRDASFLTYKYCGPFLLLVQKVFQELCRAGHGQIFKRQSLSVK